jgi:hypothetical protein
MPAEIFALLVGFDAVFEKPSARKFAYAAAVAMVPLDILYVAGELPRNGVPPNVWAELLRP